MQLRNVGKRAVVLLGGSGAVMAGMMTSAHAALSEAAETALTTAFTGAVADATELQALVITPIIGILALGIVIKLIKRFGNKI